MHHPRRRIKVRIVHLALVRHRCQADFRDHLQARVHLLWTMIHTRKRTWLAVACRNLSITSHRRRLCLRDTLRKQLKQWDKQVMINLFLGVECQDAMVLSALTTQCNHSLEAHLRSQLVKFTRERALLRELGIMKFIWPSSRVKSPRPRQPSNVASKS